MNINTVKEYIEELESSDTTFQNCNDLAALYAIRKEMGADKVEQEIDDILPAYQKYVEVKKEYQTGNGTKESVVKSINLLCREIYDLVKTLYSCSDMPLERVKIQNMIESLRSEICAF